MPKNGDETSILKGLTLTCVKVVHELANGSVIRSSFLADHGI